MKYTRAADADDARARCVKSESLGRLMLMMFVTHVHIVEWECLRRVMLLMLARIVLSAKTNPGGIE